MMALRKTLAAFALCSATLWAAAAVAQEPGKGADEALDSLLEKIDRPGGDRSGDAVAPKAGDSKKRANKPTGTPPPEKGAGAQGKADAGPSGKPGGSKTPQTKPTSGDVSTQDKEVDELLEKLGETKDEPAPDDRRPGARRPPEPSEPSEPSAGDGDKKKGQGGAKDPGLKDKDKELDEILEELAGKKRKKRQGEEQEGGGPLGEIIKEMRDVEQRLGKPDTGEDTQGKQKRIVKQIETLIEQMRQSGSSGMMAMRRVKMQGPPKPGDKPGETPGANAGGAPPMKPARPSDRHALAGGKDIWGHLPESLREEMMNVFKEEPLPAKQELIRRYYLSIAKQKLVRGE